MSVATPIWLTLRSSISMCSGRASAMVTSPPGHADCGQVRRRHHPVGDHGVTGRPERLDPLDLNARGPGAAHHRPHVTQHGGQVGHLGLLRRVLDHGRALGQDRRHEQVVRRRVAGVLEDDPGADQAAARHGPAHLAVGRLEAGAHGGEAGQVEVDRAVPEVVPARAGAPARSRNGPGGARGRRPRPASARTARRGPRAPAPPRRGWSR